MSISLLPGIEQLDPDSLSYAIYTQLYQRFFNAQDAGTITEGDITSIRLRNTAFSFAEAIAGAVSGEGGGAGEGVLSGYLKRTGGDMSGLLRADYGFAAGIENHRVLEIYRDSDGEADYDCGVSITGDLKVKGNHIHLGEQQFISFDPNTGTMFVRHPNMDFSTSSVRLCGEMLFGEDRATGIYLSPSALQVAGHGVYHTGNAGHATADWVMKDATVAGVLSVAGYVKLHSLFEALHGVRLGDGGNTLLSIAENSIGVIADLDIRGDHAICFGNKPVLALSGANGLQISSPVGDLLLGAEPTHQVRLISPLADQQGMRILLTPMGGAYFPDSLRVAHNFSRDLLSTYRKDESDQGIIIHERLRFGGENDAYMQGAFGQWAFCSRSDHTSELNGEMVDVATNMGHIPSTSLFAPKNRPSDTFVIISDADFILLGNKAEVEGSVGIAGTLTRIEKECLYLNNTHRFQSVAGGIKHYGQALFMDGVSSEFFSSGLAGSGWAILRNTTTGNIVATFDEIVVRRRLRVYQMEVQHHRASNGALWISDGCSGDSVEKL